jgi:transposase
MSAPKKQTAVEWLFEKLRTETHTISEWEEIAKQAKAMEKEQIIDAWNIGLCIQDTNDICGEYYYIENYETIRKP